MIEVLTELARKDCPKCNGSGYLVGPSGEVAVAVVCTCLAPCTRCGASGRVFVEADGARRAARCRCQKLPDRIELFNKARIPARHAMSSHATFNMGVPQGAVNFTKAQGWFNTYDPRARSDSLVLYGDVGRGKTHLLVMLLRQLVFAHGVTARFIEFSHLLAELKEGFGTRRSQAEVMAPLVQVQILAVDELGKGYNTEWERTIVDELISRRYNALRPIIATTNYEPGSARGVPAGNLAVPGQTAPSLADRVGPRVYSRLREMGTFIHIRGDDYRVVGRRR